MRAALLAAAVLTAALATSIGCGSSDAAAVCRKDAERFGKCMGEVAGQDYGAEVQRELESKIWKCAHDPDEVAVARACANAPTCEAWTECWMRSGKPAP
jgi:hypothetical protein